MYESLGFEALTPLAASVLLGLVLGGVYGVLAQRSAFCLRRSLVGAWRDCLPALGVWVMGLATAIAGTRAAVAAGLVSFEAHRFLAPDLPVASALAGGALFGAGMVLAGGCVSRLTVLVGAGNLRALLVLLVFAVTAHATMKGVLAPLRVTLGAATVPAMGRPRSRAYRGAKPGRSASRSPRRSSRSAPVRGSPISRWRPQSDC